MRIATITASSAVIGNIQKLSAQQATLQTQVATGQKIFQPEDDPAAIGRLMRIDAERRQLIQYQSNATRALEVSQASYGGIQEVKKISDRAGEIAVLGAGAANPDSLRAYAKEVNQLIEQTLQLGNTRFRNDYLFAGTALNTVPFTATRNVAGEVTAVAYAGNSNQPSIQLSESSAIAPGTTGATNTGIGDFMTNLVALRDALNANTGIPAVQATLETSENLLVNALSEHGAIELRIEINQKQQADRGQDLERLVSAEADVDLATTVVKLSQASTAYEAALASGTKILQMTILDYIN